MDILITGGNGLLGRHLVEALQERGDSVRVLVLPDEDASWLAQRGVDVHRGDVRRAETLTAPGYQPVGIRPSSSLFSGPAACSRAARPRRTTAAQLLVPLAT